MPLTRAFIRYSTQRRCDRRQALRITEAAEAILEGGAEILQFRHKTFWTRETFAQAEKIAALCREAHALFIVNDRADYAALLATWPPPASGRRSPPATRAVSSVPMDSPPFTHEGTRCAPLKPSRSTISLSVRSLPPYRKERPDPVAGIQGLVLSDPSLQTIGCDRRHHTRHNASNCWNAGADSVAVIADDLFPSPCNARTLRDRMAEWQQLSSTVAKLPDKPPPASSKGSA